MAAPDIINACNTTSQPNLNIYNGDLSGRQSEEGAKEGVEEGEGCAEELVGDGEGGCECRERHESRFHPFVIRISGPAHHFPNFVMSIIALQRTFTNMNDPAPLCLYV